MATWLKQSTAVDIAMGPFLDSTDGNTAETGLTITQPDIRLKKNGGAWAQKNAAQTLSHEEAGWYEVALDTTDTNTLGILIVAIHESGALPVWREFMVVAANIYDSMIGGGDVLDVSVTQWLGTAAATPSVAGVPEVDVTHWIGTAAATPSVAGVPEVDVTHWIGTAAATPTVAGVPEVDVTHWLGTAGQGASGRPEVDVELWLGSAPNALISGRVDATIGAVQTGAIVAASFGAGAIDAAALAADAGTEIGTAVWASAARTLTAGTNIQLPSNGLANVTAWTVDITGSLSGSVGSVTGNVGGNVTGSIGSVATGGITAGSIAADAIGASELAADAVAEIADAVWDEATTGHTTSGTFGEQLKTDVDAILADTGTDGVVVASLAANSVSASALATDAVTEIVNAVLTTQMTEAYAADGAAPTVAQALMMIQQMLGEFSITNTTLTVKKVDGSTTAATFTLNDATSPTALTRAT